MNIEIFPAEKSCDQGCFHCPMALKGEILKQPMIDEDVQETFRILEQRLKKENREYLIHHNSKIDIFPKLAHPELMKMARFGTRKDIVDHKNLSTYSGDIQFLFKELGVQPRILGFSFVPFAPLISQMDTLIVQDIIEELYRWYASRKHQTIQVTFRSNLIQNDVWDMAKRKFYPKDERYLRKLMLDLGFKIKDPEKRMRRISHTKGKDGSFYFNQYKARKSNTYLHLSNRVITKRKVEDPQKILFQQSYEAYPGRVSKLHVAIAPKGVMISHTSLSINNPILWISHHDFRRDFADYPQDSIKKIIQRILPENFLIFKEIQEQYPDEQINNNKYPEIFEDNRILLRENLTYR